MGSRESLSNNEVANRNCCIFCRLSRIPAERARLIDSTPSSGGLISLLSCRDFATQFLENRPQLFSSSNHLAPSPASIRTPLPHRYTPATRRTAPNRSFVAKNEGAQYSDPFRQGGNASSRSRLRRRRLVLPVDSTGNVSRFPSIPLATPCASTRSIRGTRYGSLVTGRRL